VTAMSRNPLLHHRRVTAGAQHYLVMIGFEHQAVTFAQEPAHRLGRPTQIRRHAECGVIWQSDAERHRFSRVVRRAARLDPKWPRLGGTSRTGWQPAAWFAAARKTLPGSHRTDQR